MNDLARAARDLLVRRWSSDRLRAKSPFDEQLWAEMIEQGWSGLLIAEDEGGLGLGAVELAALCHELGRVLAPVPFVGSVLASSAATDQALRRRIAGGELACVTFAGEQVVVDAHPRSLIVGPSGDAVPDARVKPQAGLDLTRALATTDGAGLDPDGYVASLGRLALSAESVGASERALEMAVAYAKDRIQFGKPIGSFQAIQHLLADMLRHVELARAAVERAGVALADDDPGAPEWCLIAKAKAARACVEAVEIAIQVHGGVGYTWEHDIHLYYRRVRSNAALLGDETWCNARLAALVLR